MIPDLSGPGYLLVRWTLRIHGRRFLQLVECDSDGLLELRIVPVNYLRRGLLDVDVRRNTLVLDDPAIVGPDRQVRRGDASPVDELRETEDADEAAPCALADDRP